MGPLVTIRDVGGIQHDFAVLCDFIDDHSIQNTNDPYLKSPKEHYGSKNHRHHCHLIPVRIL